ncbi:MAG: ABC transporter permease [Candidatus Thermoplasmatota archaeon]|nr:ABC transporter permease [Candidatus Thermoplasmatota archaeon]
MLSPGLAGARAVAAKHLRIFLRSPMEVTLTLFAPVLWLLLFGLALESVLGGGLPGMETTYLAYLAPGLVALTALTASLFAGATFFLEVDRGEVKQYLAAPMARVEYYLGLATSAGVKTVVQSAIILLLALPLGLPSLDLLGALIGLLIVGAFALGAFGFSAWLASKSPSFEAYHGLLILLNLPLLFLSDALYPLEQVPTWMGAIASVNPLTHLVEALRYLAVGQPSPLGLPLNLGVLAGLVVLGLYLGHRAVQGLES